MRITRRMKMRTYFALLYLGGVSLIFSNSCKKQVAKSESESILTESNNLDSQVGTIAKKKKLTKLGTCEMFQEHGTSDTDLLGDLEMIDHALRQYRKIYQQHPVGLNDEITAALTGSNPKSLAFIDPAHPSIIDFQLQDRYGTPYHFHQNSGVSMTVTSAGKDKQLFTKDDKRIHAQ